MMARSLQFAVLAAVAFLVPAIGLYLIQSWTAETRARAALEADLARYSDVLSAALSGPLWELSRSNAEGIVRSLANDLRFVSVSVTDAASGRPFVSIDKPPSGSTEVMQRDGVVHHDKQVIGIRMALAPYLEDDRDKSRANFLQLAAALGLSLGFLVFILRRLLIRPLARLTEAAERIAREDLTTSIAADYADGLGRVAVAMDGMRRRLLGTFAELPRAADNNE